MKFILVRFAKLNFKNGQKIGKCDTQYCFASVLNQVTSVLLKQEMNIMTANEQATFLYSQTVCALITAMGMQAENDQRQLRGESMCFMQTDFERVIIDHGIGYNDALGRLHDN